MPATASRSRKGSGRKLLVLGCLGTVGGTGLLFGIVLVVAMALATALTKQKEDAKRARDELRAEPPSDAAGGTRATGAPTGNVPSAGGGAIDVGAPDPSMAQKGVSRTRPASIDFDGDPYAYAPEGSGLATSDYLANAGRPGKWWGIKTDNGEQNGNPVVRADGYYTSTTSLTVNGQFLNSQRVPFVALPRGYMGARLGDYALVVNETTGQRMWAIYGDVSPKQEKSELSAALARGIGVGFEKRGTTSNASSITVTVYPGSGNLSLLSQRIGGG